MLTLTHSLRIFLCTQPVDLRKGFDGLAALVKHTLHAEPLSGSWFVFRNRSANRLKILVWEEDGFAIFYKRLEEGTFPWLASLDEIPRREISATDLAMLLAGVVLDQVQRRHRFHRPVTAK